MVKQDLVKWKNLYLSVSTDFPSNYFYATDKAYPIIVICHGFIGTKVGVNRLFVKAAKELREQGYIIVRFDYMGCGESEGDYGENTFAGFIEQTNVILTFAKAIPKVDPTDVTLIGHSLGGAVALLTATEFKEENVIDRLILWSAVGRPFNDISTILDGHFPSAMANGVSKPSDYKGYQIHESFLQSFKKYEPIKLSSRFNGDVLIIHGEEDEEIDVQYAKEYEYGFNSRKHGSCFSRTIPGACHTYSSSFSYHKLMAATKEWLQTGSLQQSEWHSARYFEDACEVSEW